MPSSTTAIAVGPHRRLPKRPRITPAYAPVRHYGLEGFGPFTCPNVVEVAEGIPFVALTEQQTGRLDALKGEIVGRGIRWLTGFDLPVFPKRRFQQGVSVEDGWRQRLPDQEAPPTVACAQCGH